MNISRSEIIIKNRVHACNISTANKLWQNLRIPWRYSSYLDHIPTYSSHWKIIYTDNITAIKHFKFKILEFYSLENSLETAIEILML